MPEYLSPGVYVEEFEMGSKPIEGVSTSTAGFLGETERGPTTSRLVTSWLQYQRVFGGQFGTDKYLPYAVEGFFANGGQRCYIGRITKKDAATASLKLKDAANKGALTVKAVGEGSWGARMAVKVARMSPDRFKLSVFYWKKQAPPTIYDPEMDPKTTPRPAVQESFDNLSVDEASPDYYGKRVNGISNLIELSEEPGDSGGIPEVMYGVVVHSGTARGGALVTITLASEAPSVDDAYSGMRIEIVGGTGKGQSGKITGYVGETKAATVDSKWDSVPDDTSQYLVIAHGGTVKGATAKDKPNTGDPPTITLGDDASGDDNFYKEMNIEITAGKGDGQLRKILGYKGSTKVATVESDWDVVPDKSSEYRVIAHKGEAQDAVPASIILDAEASGLSNVYNDTQIEITDKAGKGQIRRITNYNGISKTAAVDSNWDVEPGADSKYKISLPLAFLSGGGDGSSGGLKLDDYERTDTNKPGARKGLTGFGEIDDISIVYAPDAQPVTGLVGALITHCETLKDRFAIIDAEQGNARVSKIDPRSDHDTKYAAFYYPWIKVIDAPTGMKRLVPPGGHVAGIYARADTERGVHKAPANEVVRGAVELEFQITKGEHDILNPRGVNVIRAFPGRGIRVWGARTLSSDTIWKYINVRRLFIFLEESIEEGTQWVVFEPNDAKLWARVSGTITEFLTRVWKDGALMGSTPEEAFFVKCDETTMTQDDIDNGRLICIIGVAPVKPAEFVIFRIAQWSGGAEVTEG